MAANQVMDPQPDHLSDTMPYPTQRSARRRDRRAHSMPSGRHRAPGWFTGAPGESGGRRRIWLVAVAGGLGVGVVLLTLSTVNDGDLGIRTDIPVAATSLPLETIGPAVLPSVLNSPSSPVPTSPEEPTETPTPSPTPTPTPTATPTPTPTPSPTEPSSTPPQPVLLGPDGGSGVESMAEHYCDRYYGGASRARARSDGRWECQRFLASPRIVDMNQACADTYGSGAYAQQTGGGAYGWRCYRMPS